MPSIALITATLQPEHLSSSLLLDTATTTTTPQVSKSLILDLLPHHNGISSLINRHYSKSTLYL